MSLVTRCPACETTFKVVKDQLRISDGWVRCGRCSQVFDATLDLREAPGSGPSPSAPVPAPASTPAENGFTVEQPLDEQEQASEPSAPPDADEHAREAVEADFLDDDHQGMLTTDGEHAFDAGPSKPAANMLSFAGVVADEPWPDSDLLNLGDEGRTVVRPPLPPPLSFPNIDLSLPAPVPAPPPSIPETEPTTEDVSNAQLQKALRRARVKSAKIAKAKARDQKAASVETAPVVLAASEPEPPVEVVRGTPSFMGASGSEAFWQRPAARRSMVAAAVLAALVLIGQIIYQERDLIVARQPGLRPAMASMCQALGCQLSALRQINDIKVDGASFSREKSDEGFRLSFTLRNSADVPLAMPAVELSLLDTQERAVVRRVLMPSEFGAPSILPARAERAASMSLKLTGPEAAMMPPVAGFRVETLYP
ncbi:zinc-ribbon and DUF3426 domain-containing protein [Variovorax sp. J22P240]|uniref:zinc-ribbon and DUF3426 domain-containing protein n=2 Tax=unclassified Variovorax TaxID=663243 RepID=UPI002577D8A4|nr:zinc-ribbon and DUF3426 domain-containing protein [Variovorax sp. J22P240]MDM0000220.1 zinc-ribbon and DUF3426 domain-containing protein [Variovorax sp. J22P240]